MKTMLLYKELLEEMREEMDRQRGMGVTVEFLTLADMCEIYKAACLTIESFSPEEQAFSLN